VQAVGWGFGGVLTYGAQVAQEVPIMARVSYLFVDHFADVDIVSIKVNKRRQLGITT
jgi:hypothetical protein